MPSRITISYKVPDARALVKKEQFENLGFKGKIKNVSISDSYTIDTTLNKNNLNLISKILANPILEIFSINKVVAPSKFDWLIEVGFLPGVTDNIGATTKETIEDLIKRKFKTNQSAYTSQIFFISGTLTKTDVEKIAYSLHNPLIQRTRIKTSSEFKKEKGLSIIVPKVKLTSKNLVTNVNLDVSDEELTKIGKQGIIDANSF